MTGPDWHLSDDWEVHGDPRTPAPELVGKALVGTGCFLLLAIFLIVAALMSGGPQ